MLSQEKAIQRVGELMSFWSRRNLKIAQWYDLRSRVDKYKKTGSESAVMNDPKTFFNLAMYLISAVPAKHKIPIQTEDEEQRRLGGKAERALISIWREQDEKYLLRGKRPVRWQLSDYMLITGWYGVKVYFEVSNGKPRFVFDVLNPANLYPEWYDDGLAQIAHVHTIPKAQALLVAERNGWDISKWDKSNERVTTTTVSDYWRMGENGALNLVLYDGKLVKPEEYSGFDEIPILTGPAAGEVAWGGKPNGDATWTERYGESVLEPNSQMYDIQNRWVSFMMNIARTTSEPPIVAQTVGGRTVIQPEDIGSGKIIHTMLDEKIGKAWDSSFPQEMNVLQGLFEQKVQQGGFPYTLFGSVPPTLDLSGFAIGLLMTAAQNVVAPYRDAMIHIFQYADRVWLEGYRESKAKSIKVSGRSRVNDAGSLFHEEFKPKEVPDCTYVDVTIPLATPSDLLERVSIARQARPMGDLLDQATILETILDTPDPMLVMDRLDEDMFRNSPMRQQLEFLVQAQSYAKYLEKAGRKEEAAMLIQMIQSQMGQQPQEKGNVPPPSKNPNPEAGGTGQAMAIQAAQQGGRLK